jgi:hypothetical protein
VSLEELASDPHPALAQLRERAPSAPYGLIFREPPVLWVRWG